MPNNVKFDGKGGPGFWLANSGGEPWSDLDQYKFNPTTNAEFDYKDTTTGSYALSDEFEVKSGDQVNVAAILATAHAMPYWDFGFALLVQDKTVKEVLFAVRPDGNVEIGQEAASHHFLVRRSDGVAYSQVVKDAAEIVVNGVDYGLEAGAGTGNVATYLSAECKPPAGKYRFLFGMFAAEKSVIPEKPAAMLVLFFGVPQG